MTHAELEPGGVKIRLEADGLLAGIGRFGQPIQRAERGGEIVPGPGVIGLELQRPSCGAFSASAWSPRSNQTALRLHQVLGFSGATSHRFLVGGQRFVQTSHFLVNEAAIEPAFDGVRGQIAHKRPKCCERFLHPPVLVGGQAELRIVGLQFLLRRADFLRFCQGRRRPGEIGL